jgi:glycosyltransferase involved in cell wall biosynthesis
MNVLRPLPPQPMVTIITPSYNTGPFIEQTLRSVLTQDYPHVEHIVLDSGSTDETPGILARYPSVRLVRPAPRVMSEKVNLGFNMARGDIIAWLCADDYYLPGAISRAVEALKRHPEVALVYGNDLQVDESGAELVRTRSRQTNFRELVQEMDYVPQQTAFFRREAVEGEPMLDPGYPLVADWDLWIRISRNYPILRVDEWWGALRVRAGQRTQLHRYTAWKQGRRMTQHKHGGRFFSPLFFNYWRGKITRGALMLRRGQFRVFAAKLCAIVRGFASPTRPGL